MDASKPALVVAVVEDDASSRKALGRLLWAAGFEPALFESAEAYLDASAAPLCIVVDVQLSGMSGIELQQRLRAAGNAPPIIVTTASHEATIHERAQQNGCAGFFWKPVDGNVLIATIASLAPQNTVREMNSLPDSARSARPLQEAAANVVDGG